MVSLTTHSLPEKRDQVLRSVDLSIRDLLPQGERDPIALAMYLWVVRSHDLSLINKDGLVNWGVAWVRRVFIEKKVGRRSDEHIVSAALAAAALAGTGALSSMDADICMAIRQLLSAEIDQRPLPFGRPSYASIFLLAAAVLGIGESGTRTAKALGSAFRDSTAGGRVFGIGFAVQVLRKNHELENLDDLMRTVNSAVQDPRTGYEDELYLLQALWLNHDASSPNAKEVELTHHLLDRSPVWSYLFVGTEDVEAAGDGSVGVHLSHLCRAALVDVILRFGTYVDARADSMLDARYRGRRVVGFSAFGFVSLLLIGTWFIFGWLMMPWTDAAWRYWVQNDYGAMSQPSAFIFHLFE